MVGKNNNEVTFGIGCLKNNHSETFWKHYYMEKTTNNQEEMFFISLSYRPFSQGGSDSDVPNTHDASASIILKCF